MTRIRVATVVIAFVCCGLIAHVQAQAPGVPAQLTQLLRGLESQDWRARKTAFRSVIEYITASAPGVSFADGSQIAAALAQRPEIRRPVVDALVGLLRVESLFLKRASAGSLGEAYTEHFADVLGTVAQLGDARVIPAVIEHINSGAIATDPIAAFGSEALPQVLKIIEEPTRRQAGLLVLSAMLERQSIERVTDSDRATIKKALMRGAADQSRFVRQAAIQGLAKIPGGDVTALLRKLADSDPFVVSNLGQPAVYPIRRAAEEALRQR